MSKRPISSLDGNHLDGHDNVKTKRPNIKNPAAQSTLTALSELVQHADELISCLQTLTANPRLCQDQSHSVPTSPSVERQLSTLARNILPVFQTLATTGDKETSQAADRGEETPAHDTDVTSLPAQPHNGDTLQPARIVPSIAETSTTDPSAQHGILCPSFVMTTPWIASEIPSKLPPLPEIKDSELETAVFRHQGLGHGPNYERLEWLGDAYIELIASSLIFQTFPDTSAGRCSQLREQLVRNITLAGFLRQYDLTSRAKLPSDFLAESSAVHQKPKSKDLIKIHGDIFEAYVAAVILSDRQSGLSRAVDWLKALWGMTIKDQILAVQRSRPTPRWLEPKDDQSPISPNVSAKERLGQLIGGRGISIRYEDIPTKKKDPKLGLPLFTVGVYLDGWGANHRLLGTGTALKKTEAGQKAAVMALENRKLLKGYEEKRRAFLEARNASQEKEKPSET